MRKNLYQNNLSLNDVNVYSLTYSTLLLQTIFSSLSDDCVFVEFSCDVGEILGSKFHIFYMFYSFTRHNMLTIILNINFNCSIFHFIGVQSELMTREMEKLEDRKKREREI